MKPEGPNNAPVVFLKALVFGLVWVNLCWLGFSLVHRTPWGMPFLGAIGQPYAWLGVLNLFAIVVAVVVAAMSRLVSAEVELADKDAFVGQATEAMIKMQWKPVSSDGNTLTFNAGFPHSLVVDSLVVHIRGEQARIVGPKSIVKNLLKSTGAQPIAQNS